MGTIRRLGNALDRRPELVLWLIAGYYLLAISLRLLRSEALESDESEQLFQSQFLLLGYGRQPPFYNWLQYGVIQLLGPSILALSLVKNALLLATCLVYGLAARTIIKDGRLVAVAMLGVIALPTVFIVAQRDLTHAIATLLAVSLFTCAFLNTLIRPSLGLYLLTGTAVGIGLITKYNFLVLPIAAILAILHDPILRRRILDWRFLAALGVAAVICLPHAIWAVSHLHEATADTLKAMREDASGNGLDDRLFGLGTLALATLTGSLPVAGFFLIAFRGDLLKAWRASSQWTVVIGRTILFSLIIVGLIGIGFGATTITEKWLSPFLLLLPLYFCLKLDAAGSSAEQSVSRMSFSVIGIALIAAVYIALGSVAAPFIGRYDLENFPGQPFIEQVLANRGIDNPAYILAGDHILAGSARAAEPEAHVLVPSFMQAPMISTSDRTQPGLVIWQIEGDDPSLPDQIKPYLQANGIEPDELSADTETVPYLFSFGKDGMKFGYAWIEPDEE